MPIDHIPDVSIVVPTHDKAERLILALHALRPQTLSTSRFETVVVADGCADDTLSVVTQARRLGLHIRLIETRHAGQSAARNRGAAEARGRILLFMDDDILLHPGYVERMAEAVRRHPRAVIRAPVRSLRYLAPFRDPEKGIPFDDRASPLIAERFGAQLISRRQILEDWPGIAARCGHVNRFEAMVSRVLREGPADLRWVGYSGSGVALRRELFLDAGGYDARFGLRWGAESLELGYRLWCKGIDFIESTDLFSAHMEHPRKASLASFDASFDLFFRLHGDDRIRLVQSMIAGTDRPQSRCASS